MLLALRHFFHSSSITLFCFTLHLHQSASRNVHPAARFVMPLVGSYAWRFCLAGSLDSVLGLSLSRLSGRRRSQRPSVWTVSVVGTCLGVLGVRCWTEEMCCQKSRSRNSRDAVFWIRGREKGEGQRRENRKRVMSVCGYGCVRC